MDPQKHFVEPVFLPQLAVLMASNQRILTISGCNKVIEKFLPNGEHAKLSLISVMTNRFTETRGGRQTSR